MLSYKGSIKHITYHNFENGYTIARLDAEGEREEITIVGSVAAIEEGEHVEIDGEWTEHPKYGRQFKIDQYRAIYPTTIEGIEKYLGSGLIRGVGPVSAQRIVAHFGEETLDVIDENPMRLVEVPKLGRKRIDLIAESWVAQKQIREVMVFLQSHGITTGFAAKIFKMYGQQATSIVRNNPYRLERDIYGIGFRIADRIARSMGVELDAPQRIQAGLRYLLSKATDEGHVYLPEEGEVSGKLGLVERAKEVLDIDPCLVPPALEQLQLEDGVIGEMGRYYMPPLYHAEVGIASSLRKLIDTPARKSLNACDDVDGVDLAEMQKKAVELTINFKVLLLTGGPGTGKTTVTKCILNQFEKNSLKVALCSPTGRAAKRLGEATGREASTIHRLLEFSPGEGGFKKSVDRKLNIDALIVDEASMIDVGLMNVLLRALPDYTRLVLVGDIDQLPSVGPGNVLRDIIKSEVVPVVSLTEIFRQSSDSHIITNAHLINTGQLPHMDNNNAKDFFFVEESNPARVLERIEDLCVRRLPEHGGFNPIDDIQVLSPMYRGETGAIRINERLQERLNQKGSQLRFGDGELRVGDKVMQTKNNYEKGIFNGDMGRIKRVDVETKQIFVQFETLVEFDSSSIDELTLAYAISTHRSQGSEFPVVVLPLTTQHYQMLQRNLLYTAVTRAKKMIVIVGTKKALGMAVKNNQVTDRYTTLVQRLRGRTDVGNDIKVKEKAV